MNIFIKYCNTLEEVAKEVEKTVPQTAINWLLQRPTVSNIVLAPVMNNSCWIIWAQWVGTLLLTR